MRMSKYEEALQVATRAHHGQIRKNSTESYLEHPKRVANLLERAKFREEVVIAGLLHDVVEDSETTMEEIRVQFGDAIADIVAAHTEDKRLSWEDRKRHTIETVKRAPLEVKALIVADKLDNLQSVKKQYDEIGEGVWAAFKRGKEQQSWYNRSIVEALGVHEDEPAYFQEYRELVQSFF